MPSLTTKIGVESNFLNLKDIELKHVRKEIGELMVNGESILCAFKTIRDQVIFTNKRIFIVNVQDITGKRTSYFSYPYSKVQYYAIETAGVFDIDSELIVAFSNGDILHFDFRARVDIREICQAISQYIL